MNALKSTYDAVLHDHSRVDEALAKLSVEQSKVENMLDTFDRELTKILDSRFGGNLSLDSLAKEDVIKKFYALIKTIKGYESEINKINNEVEQTMIRNATDEGKGLEAQLNICVSACYETIVCLNTRLIKIQSEIRALNLDGQ